MLYNYITINIVYSTIYEYKKYNSLLKIFLKYNKEIHILL